MPIGKGRKRLRDACPHPLAAQLKAARVARRLSLERLGERIGYDRFVISRWENGDDVPGLRRFIDWAGGLGFDVQLTFRGGVISESHRHGQETATATTRAMPVFGASGLPA